MKKLTASQFDGIDCAVYQLDHAYGITVDTCVTIAGDTTLFSRAIKVLQSKPKYTLFLQVKHLRDKPVPFVTPEGVLLLAEAWNNSALYRLHEWLRRTVHKIARYGAVEPDDETLHAPSILESAAIEPPVLHDEVDRRTLALIDKYDPSYPWRQWVNLIVDLYILLGDRKIKRETVLRDVEKTLNNVYGFVPTQARKEMLGADGYAQATELPDFIELTGDDPQWRAIASSALLTLLHGDEIPQAPAPKKRKETKGVRELYEILRPLAEARSDRSPHQIVTLREVCARMARDEGIDWKRSATRYKNKYNVTEPAKIDLILDSTTRYYAFKRVVKRMLAEAGLEKGEQNGNPPV